MTSNDGVDPARADLMTAATDLGAALRELIEASVTTTASAAEVADAARSVREATARIGSSRRGASPPPALPHPARGRRGV